MAKAEFTSLPGEEWRTVQEFQTYEVSNLGRLRKTRPGKIPRLRKILYNKRTTYWQVLLCENYVKKMRRIHRLVAIAFVEGYHPDLEVNHKDGDKSRNMDSNLEWMTQSQNTLHAIHVLGRDTSKQANHGEKNGYSKLTELDVREILRLRATGLYNYQIAPMFKVSKEAIRLITAGRKWKQLQAKIAAEKITDPQCDPYSPS